MPPSHGTGCVRFSRAELQKQLEALRQDSELEVNSAHAGAKQTCDEYTALFRQQVSDTERTMGMLRDQHNGLQQALAMRVNELEARARPLGRVFG